MVGIGNDDVDVECTPTLVVGVRNICVADDTCVLFLIPETLDRDAEDTAPFDEETGNVFLTAPVLERVLYITTTNALVSQA